SDYKMNPLLSRLGVFVLAVGGQELAMVRYQDARQRGLIPQTSYTVDPRPVFEVPVGPGGHPVEPGFSGFAWDARHGVWIEWRNGHAVGDCSVGPAAR